MSTTTIRLPEELKSRVAVAANLAGTTTHNFILQAISEKTRQEELNADFNKLADHRYAEFLKTGEAIPWEEMRAFLEKRMSGDTEAVRPVAKKQAI